MKKYLLLALIGLMAAACSNTTYANSRKRPKADSIRIYKSNPFVHVMEMDHWDFTVKIFPEGADIPDDLEWISSNEAVLWINRWDKENGRARAIAEGTAVVYVKSGANPILSDSVLVIVEKKEADATVGDGNRFSSTYSPPTTVTRGASDRGDEDSGRTYTLYTGPLGGKYYYNSNGNKVYVKHGTGSTYRTKSTRSKSSISASYSSRKSSYRSSKSYHRSSSSKGYYSSSKRRRR